MVKGSVAAKFSANIAVSVPSEAETKNRANQAVIESLYYCVRFRGNTLGTRGLR